MKLCPGSARLKCFGTRVPIPQNANSQMSTTIHKISMHKVLCYSLVGRPPSVYGCISPANLLDSDIKGYQSLLEQQLARSC